MRTVQVKLLIARLAAKKGDKEEVAIMLFNAAVEAEELKDEGLINAVADCCKELGVYG